MARYEIKPPIDPRDRAIDLALLAYILKGAAPFYGRTKLQKTTFLSELSLRDRHLVGPRFEFYRWNNGPFSQQLWAAYDLLHTKGFAHAPVEPGLTRRGRELSELVTELKREDENRAFFRILDSVLEQCKHKTGEQLLNDVYEMEVRPESSGKKMKVRDIPKNVKIIVPPNQTSLKVAHDLEKLILQELEITEEGIRRAEEKELPALVAGFLRRVAT